MSLGGGKAPEIREVAVATRLHDISPVLGVRAKSAAITPKAEATKECERRLQHPARADRYQLLDPAGVRFEQDRRGFGRSLDALPATLLLAREPVAAEPCRRQRDRLGKRCGVLCRQSASSWPLDLWLAMSIVNPGFRTPVYASFFDREASRAPDSGSAIAAQRRQRCRPTSRKAWHDGHDATEPTGSVERQTLVAVLAATDPLRSQIIPRPGLPSGHHRRRHALQPYAIPVSLAYAGLAGLPPQVGIYGLPAGRNRLATLFGSLRQLAIGPNAPPCSLMIAGTVGAMAAGVTPPLTCRSPAFVQPSPWPHSPASSPGCCG